MSDQPETTQAPSYDPDAAAREISSRLAECGHAGIAAAFSRYHAHRVEQLAALNTAVPGAFDPGVSAATRDADDFETFTDGAREAVQDAVAEGNALVRAVRKAKRGAKS